VKPMRRKAYIVRSTPSLRTILRNAEVHCNSANKNYSRSRVLFVIDVPVDCPLRFSPPDRVWRPPVCSRRHNATYKTRPPLAAFTTSPSVLSHPSPPTGCLAAPFARILLFHCSTQAPQILSSPSYFRRPLIADSWDLLDPASLAMDSASVLTWSTAPGVRRRARSRIGVQMA